MENYTSKLLSGLSDELNNYITYTNSPKTDIDLSIGQLQVPIPTSVKETLMNGVDLESCNYVSPSGLNKLREAYKQYLVASDSKVSLTNTLITCGAKEAIFLALSAFTDGSATLLVPQTCWPGYHLIARGLGLEVVNYAINRVDWLHNLRSSIEQFPNSTLVLNTPHNPTGTEIHMNDLISIVDCCKQKRVAIVLDGVYADFTRGRSSLSSQDTIDILCDCQRWAFTHSFSKSFALAGLRIGMLLGNKEMQKAATYTRASMSSCVSVPSQQIALMLLTSNSCLRWQRETIKSAKFYLSAMRDLLASWGVSIKSTGALYLWTKDYKYETSYYPEWWSKSVHVSSGSQFGNPDYQRISIGRFEHVSTLLSRSQRSTGYHANQRV